MTMSELLNVGIEKAKLGQFQEALAIFSQVLQLETPAPRLTTIGAVPTGIYNGIARPGGFFHPSNSHFGKLAVHPEPVEG